MHAEYQKRISNDNEFHTESKKEEEERKEGLVEKKREKSYGVKDSDFLLTRRYNMQVTPSETYSRTYREISLKMEF